MSVTPRSLREEELREGLQETPARVAKAWQHWTSGYGKDAGAILKTFDDGADGYDEMVILKDAPIFSTCEHHLAPIFGTATIASTVGANTLGTPIIIGLSGFNTAYIVQGAILVALAAILVDRGFERLALYLSRHRREQ